MIDVYFDFENGVLRNKLNITNEEDLKKAESDIVSVKIREFEDNNDFEMSEEYLKFMHKYLFEELYDFAGDYRVANIEKQEKVLNGFSVNYSSCDQIPNNINEILLEMKNKNINELAEEDLCHYITDITTRIWKTHPFRDGNTRCTIIFICKYLEYLNLSFNKQILKEHASYVRDALVAASYDDIEIGIYSKKEYLLEVISDVLNINFCNPIKKL